MRIQIGEERKRGHARQSGKYNGEEREDERKSREGEM